VSAVLCVDVGYTTTRYGVWAGDALEDFSQSATPTKADLGSADPTPERRRKHWLSVISGEVRRVSRIHPTLTGVSLCFPGVVHRDGTIWRSNSIWGTTADDIRPADLEREFELPVKVTNDMTAAAFRYGLDPRFESCQDVLVVSVSSGIGAKLYSRALGGVALEKLGRNGEIALAIVDYSDAALTNDNGRLKGVLGNYSSGVGFTRLLRAAANSEQQGQGYGCSTLKMRLAECGLDIHSADRNRLNALAVQCVRDGDAFTSQVLSRSIGYLARILHTVILYAAPDALVITGGFADSLQAIYRRMLVEKLTSLFTYLYEPQELERMVHMGAADGLDNLIGCGRLACAK
jgi:predicted NBD/HSP70 family sugar kinase